PVGQALVDGGQSRAAKLDDASRLLHRGRRLLGPWAGQPLPLDRICNTISEYAV
ncbi:hypothetical protein AK812_SmicGene47249, partial [Symbiodinium microadriaticum]